MPERTLAKHLRRTLRKRLQRVLETGRDALAHGRSDEAHALRIAIKRLRYDLEFVAALAPEATPPATRLLVLLQERLGTLADLDAFARTYHVLLVELPPGDARRPGLESLLQSTERERKRALAAVRTAWSGEGGGPYLERLAASISAAVDSLSPKAES